MEKKCKCIIETKNGYGSAVLRILVGLTFMLHGSQKLFGLFGGGGLEGTTKYMASLGIEPASLMALLAGLGEFVGGFLLLIGFVTRFGAIATAIVSLVAIFAVHIHKGFFITAGGYEYALVLLAASIMFIIDGAGKLSVDNYIQKGFSKENLKTL